MFVISKKIITATVIGALSLSGLTACVVSDDPYVNTTATAATTAGVVSLLLYSLHDGYYYDQDYRRMPQHYRPPHNVQIVRVNNIHEYRRAHPRPAVRHTPQTHTQRPHDMWQREQQLKRQHEMRRQNEQQLKRQERELKRNEQQLKRQHEMQRRNEQQIRRQEQIKRDNRSHRIERKNERKNPRRYKKYDD